MSQNKEMKLFICYSHQDEPYIKEFVKHISPLKNNGLIKEWYDRKLIGGEKFQDSIDNNLENADIICLFISSNFLSSLACINEKKKSVELKKKKGISVIPIILSPCGWHDDKDISNLLALPIDGKPVSNFSNIDSAWLEVYNELKKVIENILLIRKLDINNQFKLFLESTEIFTKAHSQKREVFLEDIFVFPELERYDFIKEIDKKYSSEKLINEFCINAKILIAGENQSGKTTLCKKIFVELLKKNFVPIYIYDKSKYFKGLIENRIKNAFEEQYKNGIFEDIEKERVVVIIDDFHFAKRKEKIIYDLALYKNQIIVVDDIFSLNFKDDNLIKAFNQFKIKQFNPTLRNCLIEKWIYLKDNKSFSSFRDNDLYKEIDNATELVDSTLGKIISSGIMPAYPFFILSIVSTYETFEKPLDQEITSQGYCYQALIYLFLRKQGVKNEDIDTYINFLTEFAFFIYKEKKQELPIDDFDRFMVEYLDKFNLPVSKELLLQNLQETKIIRIDSFNNYSFNYQYLYYFFVAKYLAEHYKGTFDIIELIINNLHTNENAYIAIFLSHHSKNINFLNNIISNATKLFNKYEPATLTKNELKFFDDNIDKIVKAVLPPLIVSPDSVRAENLKNQDIIEEKNELEETKKKENQEKEDENDILDIEIRRSVKTVEVMGIIIKNRAGSLEINILEKVFEEAMNVHLRILTSFFELIKSEREQDEIVSFIKKRIDIITKDKPKKLTSEQLERLARTIFWNINFLVVLNFIDKIIHSLGSDKLQAIIDNTCNKINTPVSFLIKHGILMWYSKNLQIDNIANKIKDDGFSDTAERIIKFIISYHCSVHKINFKDKQKIEQKFNIPIQKLLIPHSKEN